MNNPFLSGNLIINEICRCCHSQGVFMSLSTPYNCDGREEIYSKMLQDTFNIILTTVVHDTMESKSSICDTCINRLRDAVLFKEQVMLCEQALGRHYGRRILEDVKKEEDSLSDREEIEYKHIDVKYIKEEYSLSDCAEIEYKYSKVKMEPVDTQDGDDQHLSVLKQESQGELEPQLYSEERVMAGAENRTDNTNTIVTFHLQNGCPKTENCLLNNQPKTAAERMREYRSRIKIKRQQNIVNRPKTAAERMREYRARKRRNEIEFSINQNEDGSEFVAGTSELFGLSYVRRPKTVLERVREHRARKKNEISKVPKTAKERVQEYRARKKNHNQQLRVLPTSEEE